MGGGLYLLLRLGDRPGADGPVLLVDAHALHGDCRTKDEPRAARLLRALALPKTEKRYPKGERMTEAQVRRCVRVRAGEVVNDKRRGKRYQSGKAPVLLSEEERLPAAKKAKKSKAKKSA